MVSRSQPTECKTLWIGDIEQWMDESYIQSLFQGLGNSSPLTSLASVTSVKLIKDRVAGLPDCNFFPLYLFSQINWLWFCGIRSTRDC